MNIDVDTLFFNDTATTEIYTLSLHDALPIYEHDGRQSQRARAQTRRGGLHLLLKILRRPLAEDRVQADRRRPPGVAKLLEPHGVADQANEKRLSRVSLFFALKLCDVKDFEL